MNGLTSLKQFHSVISHAIQEICCVVIQCAVLSRMQMVILSNIIKMTKMMFVSIKRHLNSEVTEQHFKVMKRESIGK